MPKHPLWIVLADGEHARILVPGDTPETYRTIEELNPQSAQLQPAGDTPHHSTTPHASAHQQSKQDFATHLAAFVGAAAENGAYERLVLVAPPHALHDLRTALPTSAQSRLIGVLQHDLTKTPDHKIANHLIWDVLHGGTLAS